MPAIPENLIWPGVALILGLLALLMFRKPISTILVRLKSASKEGVTFEHPQEGIAAPSPLPLVELLREPTYASILEREAVVKKQVQALQLKNESEQIAVLERALATSHIRHEFDNISNIIFGSQLRFLVHLSSSFRGASISEAEGFFKEAQEAFPSLHANRTVDEWLKYSNVQGLAEQKDGRIDVTQRGAAQTS